MDRLLELFRKFPEIESERLLFRDILHSDSNDLFEIYRNRKALKFQVISPFRSMAEVKRYVDVVHDGYQNRYFIRWGLVEKQTGKLIGLISLHHLELWNYKAEIGYMLNEAYWNMGYATEAVDKLLEMGLVKWGLHKVEAEIHPGNAASMRVVEKLGFVKDGYKREAAFDREKKSYQDRILYSLLADEYKKK